MRYSKILENKISSDTYWRAQLVYIKFQAHSCLVTPLEYSQEEAPVTN